MDWFVGSRNVENHTVVVPVFCFRNPTDLVVVGILDVGVVG